MPDESESQAERQRYRGLIFRSGEHGEYVITREAVEGMLEQLQAQPVPMNVEHDPTKVPVGRVLGGRLHDLEDGEVGLEADMEFFESSTSVLIRPVRDFGSTLASLAPIEPDPASLDLVVDTRSYAPTDLERLRQIGSEAGDVVVRPGMARFSQLPDALLIIALGLPVAATWWFARGFFTKAGEASGAKVGDEIGEELVAAYRAFKRYVRDMVSERRTPAESPPITMLTLEIPRESGGVVEVEGSTRADDESLEHFLDAGSELLAVALAYVQLMPDPDRLAKLHFRYADGQWRFAYGLDDAAQLVMVAFMGNDQYDRALRELRDDAGEGSLEDPLSERRPPESS